MCAKRSGDEICNRDDNYCLCEAAENGGLGHACIAANKAGRCLIFHHSLRSAYFKLQLHCVVVNWRLLFSSSVLKEIEAYWELASFLEITETFFLSHTKHILYGTAINTHYEQQIYKRKTHILYILKHLNC